ncbi:hypothetical protein ACEPAH_64 [Sanghuangporus vaninii]
MVLQVLDDGTLPEEDHLHGIHTTRKSSGETFRYPESINSAADILPGRDSNPIF